MKVFVEELGRSFALSVSVHECDVSEWLPLKFQCSVNVKVQEFLTVCSIAEVGW